MPLRWLIRGRIRKGAYGSGTVCICIGDLYSLHFGVEALCLWRLIAVRLTYYDWGAPVMTGTSLQFDWHI